jgi:hypothetical protein
LSAFILLNTFLALNNATPPPATIPSSAARLREVHHQLCLFSFISTSEQHQHKGQQHHQLI